MLIKLAALGALGYFSYKILQSAKSTPAAEGKPSDLRLAGGPLSESAELLHTQDAPLTSP